MQLLILFLAGISLGFAYICEKKLALDKFHPATYVVLVAGASAILSSPLLFYQFKVSSNLSFWLLALVSVLAYGLGNLFSFKAFKLIDASVVGLINRLNLIVTAGVGIIFLAEVYSFKSYAGFILILIGSLIIVYEKGKLKVSSGIIFAIIMAVGYGLAAVFDKVVLREFSPFTYIVLNNFLVALFFSSYKTARNEAIELFRKHTALVLLTGALSAGSWIGFLFVLQSGAVSKISPIYDGLALICTVIMGVTFLKEKEKLAQKIIGTIAVLLGVFLLR